MGEVWAAAVAVGTVAVGAYTAYEGAQAADAAGERQERAMDSQAQVAQDQLNFGKEQYGDWKDMFYPAFGDLRDMAYEEQRPNFMQISADVDSAFDTSQDINRRTMERYGVSPTDGAFNASETQYGLGRAMATVGANNTARQQAKDSQFNRLTTFANIGNGQQAAALGTMNQGFGNAFNAQGNQAALYGQQADQYAQAAAAGAQMAGRGLSSLAGQFGGGGGNSFYQGWVNNDPTYAGPI